MKYIKTIPLLLVLVMLIPVVYAMQPTEASGELLNETVKIKDIRYVDNNTIITATTTLEMTGTFNGVFVDNERAVIKSNGDGTLKGLGTFSGSVDGVSGNLELSVVSTLSEGGLSSEGKFVILSGTEGLSNLRGEGTFYLEDGAGSYLAKLHFHPG